ncbi:hypothetical protein WJX72_001307 [[Myrmecia] bisecta]|uniref:Chlorophyll(Ide) b reductase n=1 Tax=[Myrmecia] bisecta TaxID=41462 RepID=A0AAW1QE48_9CHLO
MPGFLGRRPLFHLGRPSQQAHAAHFDRRRRQRCGARSAAGAGASSKEGPFNVVVTGSSKGIGLALAREFVRAGDSVLICSRNASQVAAATEDLQRLAASSALAGPTQVIAGAPCNVANPAEVAALADFAHDRLGTVDIWINNAGSNAYKYSTLTELDPADLVNIVETNLLGVMLGCREAIRVMRTQATGGHIMNMDGAGADGGATPRFAAYGATKRGLAQLGKSLQAELKMQGINNVGIHNLSPGMVTTELLMSGTDTSTAKFFVNCLAESPETVAEYLVPRVRRVPAESRSLGGISSQYIRYLTKAKAYTQILMRLVAGQRKNRWVAEDQ